MSSERININEANEEVLVQLPGIAQALAARIVQYRENIHPFENIEDLAAVPGISERMVRSFADLITVVSARINGSAQQPAAADEDAELIAAEAADEVATAHTAQEETADESISETELEGLVFEKVVESAPVLVDPLAAAPILDETEESPVEEAQAEAVEAAVQEEAEAASLEEAEVADDEDAGDDFSHSVDVEAVLTDESELPTDIEVDVDLSEFTDEPADEEPPADEVEADTADEDGGLVAAIEEALPPDIEISEPMAEDEPAAVPAAPLFSQGAATAERSRPQPQPAPVVERRRLDWRTISISTLLGAGLTLLLLALLNGGLIFASRNNATALQQTINQQTATIGDQIDTITSQAEQVREQAALIDALQEEVSSLSGSVDTVRDSTENLLAGVNEELTSLDDAVATLGTALATTNSEIISLQEIDAALQEVDTLLGERIDTVAGSAEEVDEFLTNLRDLLIGLKGIPEPAAPATETPATVQPTRTPRPTPTPLAVPTQNP